MKKVLSTILLATLVLSVMAVIPVNSAIEGQLTTSSIGNTIYLDQFVEIRVTDNDLNTGAGTFDPATIKIELKDPSGTLLNTTYVNANETFVNSGEFVIYLQVNSTYVFGAGVYCILDKAYVAVMPGLGSYYAVVYNSTGLADGSTFVITYPEAGSTPKTVTLTYKSSYKTTNADLSLDRSGDTPEYPFYGGYYKLYIKDYDQNKDPTKKDQISLTINMTDVVSPNINEQETITFTETGINTGVFVATIQYANATSTGGDGIFQLLNPNTGTPIKVIYKETTPTNEAYTLLKFKQYTRSLDVASTFTTSSDLLIRIQDNNENVRSWDVDTISGYVNVSVGSDFVVIAGVNFTEIGSDAGVFEYTLPVTIGTPATTNDKLEFASGTFGNDVSIVYKDSAGNDLASAKTKLSTTAAILESDKTTYKPTESVTLTLTAPDLNVDSNYNIYTITVAQYSLVNNVQTAIGGVAVGNFSVKVNDGYANVTDTAGLTLNFVETGTNTGKFTATLPLSKIKTTSGGALSDGDTVKVIWYDLINSKESSVTLSIGVPASEISLDRSSYPAPKDGDVKVKVTVKDPDVGTSSTIDTISNALNVTLYYLNGTQVPGIATGPFNLIETGPATYEFTYTYTLSSVAVTQSPAIIGGTIKATYWDSSANKLVTATATISNTDASITANVSSATAGTAVKFTINDPDANRDGSTAENLPVVSVEYTPVGSTSTTTTTWTFKETGKSTGVFEYTITLGKDFFAAPGSTIKVTYEDKTPSFITNEMSSYSSQSYSFTVKVPSF
ncbi:MAG: hypothetical protein QXS54_12475, partial [Candidatus Methanomethylicaceae archaeon]